ncbi:type IV toxin-antitoxin system AbiEi family antitoxin domain-containing protein [Aeromicrobium sp.]|uniref:type IV toxin-antitoxin system AbiEi family antitoxin domain-containing protein n=1 Tax=Aeromicrobium sp. TaxID=1871063 RepID=UPI002FCB4090
MATPLTITRAPLRTVRPADLTEVYAQPGRQLQYLAKQGRVRHLAHGYYCAIPDDQGPDWEPTVEAAAAGIATAIYGDRAVILMGMTAARVLGGYPRAIGKAVVAVPGQHEPVRLTFRKGVVRFMKRTIDALDARLERTELGPVLTTTPEQTVLDLTKRPGLAGTPEAAAEAIRNLLPQCDRATLERIADAQKMRATLARLDANRQRR